LKYLNYALLSPGAQAFTAVESTPMSDHIASWVAILEATFGQMAESNSPAGIRARQRDAMTSISSRLQDAVKARHHLPVPTPQELYEAEAALRSRAPQTPEQAEEVSQFAAQMTADSEKRKLIERLIGGLTSDDVARLTPYAVLVLLYWWLCYVTGLPLIGKPLPSQDPAYLAVIGILVAGLAIIRSQK
jgi:hypothetical protein